MGLKEAYCRIITSNDADYASCVTDVKAYTAERVLGFLTRTATAMVAEKAIVALISAAI